LWIGPLAGRSNHFFCQHARYSPNVLEDAMSDTSRPTLFSQIVVQHGPAGLLGRLFLLCEAELHRRGIRLRFAGMDELLAVNRANADTWAPLWSGFDPSFTNLSPENSFCILGCDLDGNVVATQAARFLDWPDTNYHEEAESLRLMYADPDASKLPGERCRVTALAAKGMSGRVAYSGAAWYRPDYRGKALVEFLPRISRSLAHTRWDTHCTVTMMAEAVVRGKVFPRNGYRNIEWDIKMYNSRGQIPRFALIWSKRDEMLEDLKDFLGGFETSIDAARRLIGA
jgi:hypothetical protein